MQTRRNAAQNRAFQQEAQVQGGPASALPLDTTSLPRGSISESNTRPDLVLINSQQREPDLSKLKPTAAFVYRRGRRPR
jgi:hypothetical protein